MDLCQQLSAAGDQLQTRFDTPLKSEGASEQPIVLDASGHLVAVAR
jgi:hypothetical protein